MFRPRLPGFKSWLGTDQLYGFVKTSRMLFTVSQHENRENKSDTLWVRSGFINLNKISGFV